MVLEKTVESPLDRKEIQSVHSKGDRSWVSLEGMMLKLKLQYFGYLMQRVDSLEKTLMLGGIGGRRRRGRQRIQCFGRYIFYFFQRLPLNFEYAALDLKAKVNQ